MQGMGGREVWTPCYPLPLPPTHLSHTNQPALNCIYIIIVIVLLKSIQPVNTDRIGMVPESNLK